MDYLHVIGIGIILILIAYCTLLESLLDDAIRRVTQLERFCILANNELKIGETYKDDTYSGLINQILSSYGEHDYLNNV